MSKEIMKKKTKTKNRKLGSRGIKLNHSVSAIFHSPKSGQDRGQGFQLGNESLTTLKS